MATNPATNMPPENSLCPFCDVQPPRILHHEGDAIVFRDAHPVSPGHTLIVPRRHVRSLFEATNKEVSDLMHGLRWARSNLETIHSPDGYNVGINDGEAAGQTVMHLHVRLMPRYRGDQADPRGGVRWLFPKNAAYWEQMTDATEPTAEDQLAFLGNLQRILEEGDFTATYKYALLIALADLSVERPAGEDGTVVLPVLDLAERIIELYWRQATPFREAGVLLQEYGPASVGGPLDFRSPFSCRYATNPTRTSTLARASAQYAERAAGATAVEAADGWLRQTHISLRRETS
ncbi:MAG: HIT family protein [Betaproteobacteria bacterium]